MLRSGGTRRNKSNGNCPTILISRPYFRKLRQSWKRISHVIIPVHIKGLSPEQLFVISILANVMLQVNFHVTL